MLQILYNIVVWPDLACLRRWRMIINMQNDIIAILFNGLIFGLIFLYSFLTKTQTYTHTHTQITGYFISKPFSRRVDILFGAIAIPLFLASGYFILTQKSDELGHQLAAAFDTNDSKKLTAKGWLSVANGVIFIADIVFHCFE